MKWPRRWTRRRPLRLNEADVIEQTERAIASHILISAFAKDAPERKAWSYWNSLRPELATKNRFQNSSRGATML